MAQILIKAQDASHPNPIKDQRGCYKRGMPVGVFPDSHQFGTSEGLPTFVILKLPGVPVSKVEQFIEAITDAEGSHIRRRLWQVSWADLPVGARNKLLTNGSITIGSGGDYTWSQFRNYLKRFDTGASAPSTL